MNVNLTDFVFIFFLERKNKPVSIVEPTNICKIHFFYEIKSQQTKRDT